MHLLTGKQVVEVVTGLLHAAGAREADARIVGEYLARANLYGVDSHGIQNSLMYVDQIRKGIIKTKTRWRVVKNTSTLALIDGKWGIGQVICTAAMNLAVKKAARVGVGTVGIYNCNHVGRLGDYPLMAARHNMIGMIFGNCEPSVAPYGGTGRMLGTNPMSFAFPTGTGKPIMVDFASSASAEGKIRAALLRGDKIPEGWIIDKDGKPTTNPGDLYSPPMPPEAINYAGAQLPAAGHKGFGLALVVDIMGGALTGSDCGVRASVGNGVFLQAVNIKSFISPKKYSAMVDRLVGDIKSSPRAEGFNEILMPGEPELRTEEKRNKEGIPVPDATWDRLSRVAGEYKLDLDNLVRSAH